jgi:hypothetical protein
MVHAKRLRFVKNFIDDRRLTSRSTYDPLIRRHNSKEQAGSLVREMIHATLAPSPER